MKRTWIALFVFLAPAVAVGQPIKIHGHPQKAEYASSAEWITPSAQCHGPVVSTLPPASIIVTDLVNGTFGGAMINHTHLDWTHPAYGEIDKPFVSNFLVTLRNTNGFIDGNAGGLGSFANQVENVVWDATGTATPPVMMGKIDEVRSWGGHFTFNPRRIHPADGLPATPHGWYVGRIIVRTRFDNGASVDTENITNFYSMLDPSQPENFPPGEGRIVGAWCTPNIVNRPDIDPFGTQFGVVRSEYTTFVPIAPIQSPFTAQVFPYSYTAKPGLPEGLFEQRHDLDLHMGKPGLLVKTDHFPGDPGKIFPIVFDPAAMGSGDHRVAQLWQQTDGQRTMVSALIVMKVTVGPGVPPPTTCTDPLATNRGGALPCVFPAPTDSLRPAAGGVVQLFTGEIPTGRYFVCPTTALTVAACKELGVK